MPLHIPVLSQEVVHYLDPQPGHVIVDATVGTGGHARMVAEKVGPQGRLVGLDQDADMLALAREHLESKGVMLVHGSFEDLPEILQKLQIAAADGILADLGFCSDQLADPLRGLSFKHDGPLDMRLDRSRGEPAADLVRRLHERALADILWQFGEERFSRRIARRIVEARQKAPITTTGQLAELVRGCVPRSHGIDPATRVFQALRIAVNDELGALDRFLFALPDCLKPGGRAVIISFHSLEDRRVKRAFRDQEYFEELTRKPAMATDEEIRNNPRAHSAKLRAARKKPGTA
ncbi:MAG TPA: 16S rRNA (cytosine(1402)-N(4))-methyltransferase RsmH [Gemmataceae bacterium]|jgi:16S rRNA (cytosine1402-N4)-methyltransferase|nr:16S rRNA (cytosine(1402)-N(4))-methyltransferase RsmH [Gemmataceae bacterium]